jgi:hypothetical protein
MIPMIDVPAHQLQARADEIGAGTYGQLITSLTRHSNRGDLPFAIDNGAYSGFNVDAFVAVLRRELPNRTRCVFIAVPDVVGSARRTLEAFSFWYPKLHGWPLALVAQDGIESLEVPWNLLAAIFIGGSDAFKDGRDAAAVVKCAKIIGKWVHVGRVNTVRRWRHFQELGADSCDGTGLCLPGGSYQEERAKIKRYLTNEPDAQLFQQGESCTRT